MLISQLPPEIKEKALSLQKQETEDNYSKETDDLSWAFNWEHTGDPNGDKNNRWSFWSECFKALTSEDLPEMPDYI